MDNSVVSGWMAQAARALVRGGGVSVAKVAGLFAAWERHAIGYAAAACGLVVVVGLVLGMQASSLRPVRPGGLRSGFRKRMLAMELVKTEADVNDILGTDPINRVVVEWQQRIDFLFIGLYWFAFLSLALVAGRTSRNWGIAIGIFATVAALADIMENRGILTLTRERSVTVRQVEKVRLPALTKWYCIFVTLTALAPLFWQFPGTSAHLTGVLLLLAGQFGAAVIFSSRAILIEVATGLMAGAVFFAWMILVWQCGIGWIW